MKNHWETKFEVMFESIMNHDLFIPNILDGFKITDSYIRIEFIDFIHNTIGIVFEYLSKCHYSKSNKFIHLDYNTTGNNNGKDKNNRRVKVGSRNNKENKSAANL